jgi:glycosyltransferase involved in cell wall biosynthesis
MKENSTARKIAFVGNYPPRKCGIATFTRNLLEAVATEYSQSQCLAAAVNDFKNSYEYPDVVRLEIEEQDLLSYLRAADFLNLNNVDIVCLQHEFGIFGGSAGGHIVALLRKLRMPVVTTLHTILRQPTADQHRVMRELVGLSARLVAMAKRGKQILQETYRIPPAKIDLIPHGIPDVEFLDPEYFKGQFGVQGRPLLLTFGLLSPNKGIEYVLEALPQIVAKFPEVVYIVLGATHPNELRAHGEAYRLSLETLAKKNKIEKNVIFCNQYVELENLKEFIGAADIYITPYLNEAQITSGTLAYTLGAGKAVISTPYWHAAELLTKDRGVLVPFADSAAIARATASLLCDDARRHTIRKNAYRFGREMVWSSVARQYMRSFVQAAESSRTFLTRKALEPRELPELQPSRLSASSIGEF